MSLADLSHLFSRESTEAAKQNLQAVRDEAFRHLESIRDGIARVEASVEANRVDNEVTIHNLRVESDGSSGLVYSEWIGPPQGSYWLIEQVSYKTNTLSCWPFLESNIQLLHVAPFEVTEIGGTGGFYPIIGSGLDYGVSDTPKFYVRSGQLIRLGHEDAELTECHIQVQQFTKEPKFDSVG